ncbi:MAG: hypothetical protein NQ127_04270, partial [Candidatus Cardinium sp.]|nr:hypothetical protein [Candidatus Cardinium sp.]
PVPVGGESADSVLLSALESTEDKLGEGDQVQSDPSSPAVELTEDALPKQKRRTFRTRASNFLSSLVKRKREETSKNTSLQEKMTPEEKQSKNNVPLNNVLPPPPPPASYEHEFKEKQSKNNVPLNNVLPPPPPPPPAFVPVQVVLPQRDLLLQKIQQGVNLKPPVRVEKTLSQRDLLLQEIQQGVNLKPPKVANNKERDKKVSGNDDLAGALLRAMEKRRTQLSSDNDDDTNDNGNNNGWDDED